MTHFEGGWEESYSWEKVFQLVKPEGFFSLGGASGTPFYMEDVVTVVAESSHLDEDEGDDGRQIGIVVLRDGRCACLHAWNRHYGCESCGGVWDPIHVRVYVADKVADLVRFALTPEERALLGFTLRGD